MLGRARGGAVSHLCNQSTKGWQASLATAAFAREQLSRTHREPSIGPAVEAQVPALLRRVADLAVASVMRNCS